ncbi:MAG: hypothetical protein ACLTS6_09310 [Anaerobutyricum sp.]
MTVIKGLGVEEQLSDMIFNITGSMLTILESQAKASEFLQYAQKI